MAISGLKRWVAGETFTARSYVYERDLIVDEVNRIAGLYTGDSDLSVNTIEIGGHLVEWNDVDGTLNVSLNDDVTLQVGQEQVFYAKAYQQDIANGAPVMFAGVEGNHFRIRTATTAAINANPELFIGVATQDIAAGEFGYVTEFGFVRDFDTELYGVALGDILWFDSENGGWTADKPARGNAQIRAAVVVTENQNQNQLGSVFVRISILEGIDGASGAILFTTDADPTVANTVLDGDVWFDNN